MFQRRITAHLWKLSKKETKLSKSWQNRKASPWLLYPAGGMAEMKGYSNFSLP